MKPHLIIITLCVLLVVVGSSAGAVTAAKVGAQDAPLQACMRGCTQVKDSQSRQSCLDTRKNIVQ
ncbi:MAG: hypothetical protein ACXV5F_06300 [Halobacteriota archaeon]